MHSIGGILGIAAARGARPHVLATDIDRMAVRVARENARSNRGGTLTEFPADLKCLSGAEPVYERMPGWSSPTKGVTRFEDLPDEARRYVRRLEEVTGVDCAIISTGSDRSETILETGSIVERWLAAR